jgi:HAD superfamily hydrolase (TIGR01509 family)
MIKGVIFDLDGLLAATELTYQEGWIWAFEQFHLSIPREVVASWSGKSWLQTADYLDKRAGGREKVLAIRKVREQYVYEKLTNDEIPLKPFAKEILDYLKENDYYIGLATSTVKKRASDMLTHWGIIDYFEDLTFGDEVKVHKPKPDSYLCALAKAGLKPTEAFAVEDSLIGATAATAAGMGVILIPDSSIETNFTQADKAPLRLLAEGTTLEVVKKYLQDTASTV